MFKSIFSQTQTPEKQQNAELKKHLDSIFFKNTPHPIMVKQISYEDTKVIITLFLGRTYSPEKNERIKNIFAGLKDMGVNISKQNSPVVNAAHNEFYGGHHMNIEINTNNLSKLNDQLNHYLNPSVAKKNPNAPPLPPGIKASSFPSVQEKQKQDKSKSYYSDNYGEGSSGSDHMVPTFGAHRADK